ncbi:hypothetical protein Q7P35_008909 [Cladosporium inversicolor]
MADEAYSQDLTLLENWDQWRSPEAGSPSGTTVDPGAPRPFTSPSPYAAASPSVSQIETDRLRLLQPNDWDKEKDYGADPPVCIRYTIIWKVKLNSRMIARDTEQDIVLAPAAYWSRFLQAKLNALLGKKVASGKRIKPDDSDVVVSVNERSERDLVRRFDEINVDWSVVEKQLLSWGELLRAGKHLRVEVAFNYVDVQVTASASAARGGSATQRMLAERAAQLDAEEASGAPSTWRDVYLLMRCPGPPCELGPHCWRDPDGKKHYRLKAHHMKSLIRHVQEGGQLESHADVPEIVRQQLYAEQQERLQRKRKASNGDSNGHPPITINNVLPASTGLSTGHEAAGTASTLKAAMPRDFELPGFHDVALHQYSEWHQSRVFDTNLKADFKRARDVALENALDLDLIHEENDPNFFEQQGVKRGTAKRFVRDIERWVKRHKAQDTDAISVVS